MERSFHEKPNRPEVKKREAKVHEGVRILGNQDRNAEDATTLSVSASN
jgi:hypothetical protein